MRETALVWIDANEAILVRWRDEEALVGRVESDVPPRRRSTRHVRYDPTMRHGGGGPQDADSGHREEHLARFMGAVVEQLGPDEDVLILGPGTVRDRLERTLLERDGHHVRRTVESHALARRTEPQLIARLRRHLGDEPARRGVASGER